jgi:hypothetical protein
MKKIAILTLLLTAATFNAEACSLSLGQFEFKPGSNFEVKMQDGAIALLPAPKVEKVKITRGSSDEVGTCGDLGFIEIHLEWPEESAYSLEEIGFYFQSDNGSGPGQIFPLGPIQGTINKNSARFYFVWLDGHPRHHKALDFKVNVFAVNGGLQIGPFVQIKIESKDS